MPGTHDVMCETDPQIPSMLTCTCVDQDTVFNCGAAPMDCSACRKIFEHLWPEL